ncbi:oxidoreductase [Microbulbifer sp. OS29]|uniref:Oxidoreductase n=1 Tax=Microbulbifer okhotskensis TaxID=2926617 RepID=A0A9X2J5R9_9GAMM|nr:oxidoreductase [Microbulbifer okhotskensis]MCO1335488.1 oxidoreductase [Microbulbifer okhotskensis]
MSTTETIETITHTDDFYVIAREPGAEHPALPTWATHSRNPVALAEQSPRLVSRRNIASVPGAFQLLNVFSQEECQRLIDISEAVGYLPDAAVSLPREVRHNDNLTWVVDEVTERLIWQRCQGLMQDPNGYFGGRPAVGINQRFRFYRYSEGDFFQFHTDGAWPGSKVIDNKLITNGYPDRYSEMTFLILLNDDFDGGATCFRVNADDPLKQPNQGSLTDIDIRTPAGAVLCFPHGMHPLHRIHSSTPITRGSKYIIRTDILFLQE